MKRVILIGLFLALLGLMSPVPVAAMTGAGTEGDPYIISDLTDLQAMADGVTYAVDAYYELANDIDASATTTWNWDAGRGVYEGFLSRAFEGHFDGNYYAINDLYMDRYAGNPGLTIGLFQSADGATIMNVLILGADITGHTVGSEPPISAGVLVGMIASSALIQNVYVSGSLSATVDDTYSPGSHHSMAGGLVGQVNGGSITIERCGAYVNVTSIALDRAIASAGGLVGVFTGSDSVVSDSYARGIIYASNERYSSQAGGLVGLNIWSGSIDNCYSTGPVSGTDETGGLIASADIVAADSFWDAETSNQPTSDGGTGKTTTEMQTESTFTSAGWDFSTIWDIKGYVNDGYPYLLWWYTPEPWGEWSQVLLFEPITIISGTTLPDRAGAAQNGAITWGDNPAGIAIEMGELVSGNQPPIVSSPDNPATSLPDMTGESGQPDWTATQPTLTDNPFYPIVDLISGQMNIPLWLVWVILALFILLIIMAVSFRYAPHQLITALAGGGWCAFMYHMGIFPFWVMFIFAAMALAIVIGERTPTVS